MKAKTLATELDEGFQSAADSLFESDSFSAMTIEIRASIRGLLTACANNAAQALADRTITSKQVDALANYEVLIDEIVGQYLQAGARCLTCGRLPQQKHKYASGEDSK